VPGYQRHPTNHVDGPPRQRSHEEWLVDALQDYEWLREWQRQNNYSDQQAADELALSLSAFRRQRSGGSRVSRQTAKLAILSIVDLKKFAKIGIMAAKLYGMNTLDISDDT
jgi:hypothetical protein